MTNDEAGKAVTKDGTQPAEPDQRSRETWCCPPGLWKRWCVSLPEGSDPVRSMAGRVRGLVRNVERQAGHEMRTTSWVLPVELVDRIAETAETQQVSPSEWAEGVLAQALDRQGQGA